MFKIVLPLFHIYGVEGAIFDTKCMLCCRARSTQ